jgi:ankyrin repeat protein
MQDIKIFQDTPVWELAQAVEREDEPTIKRDLNKNISLINYQDPHWGITLLIRAIGTDKFRSAQALLDCGTNPNVISKGGNTALMEAISYRWNDTDANDDPKYVKLLLDYGADPNIQYCPPKERGISDVIEYGSSPLIYSISMGFDKVKLLVESGAEVNYKTKLGTTAAIKALLLNDLKSAYYLIVEKKAKVASPYYYYSLTNDTVIEKDNPHYPIDLLLDWTYEIGSSNYQKKMMIVQEFKKQGIDYNRSKKNISNLILRKIKKNHPIDWQEYLEKY